MRDGKIQHVEVISEEKRKKRVDELNKEYVAIKEGKKITREKFMNTVVRQPTDYKTHPNYQKADLTFYEFSQEYKKMQSMTQEDYENLTNLKPKNGKHVRDIMDSRDGEYTRSENEHIRGKEDVADDGEEGIELSIIQ